MTTPILQGPFFTTATTGVLYKSGVDPESGLETITKLYKTQSDGLDLRQSNLLAGQEYAVAQYLFERNFPVPKPIGVFRFDMSTVDCPYANANRDVLIPGFTMEYLNATDLYNLDHRVEYDSWLREKQDLIRQIESLGVVPNDYWEDENGMWSDERNKLYLIDFIGWSLPGLLLL